MPRIYASMLHRVNYTNIHEVTATLYRNNAWSVPRKNIAYNHVVMSFRLEGYS